jgi:hypothetical protein
VSEGKEPSLGSTTEPTGKLAAKRPMSFAGDAGGRPNGGSASHAPQSDERVADEREMHDRDVTEEREFSDDQRFEMFVDGHMQSVLPNLPYRPGFHVCWLTTSNARDSIANRIRFGYRPLRVESIPGWDGITSKVGDLEGIVSVNEMIAAEIPLSLYYRYMRENHYTLPLAEEEKLRGQVDQLGEEAARYGARMTEGDGTRDHLVQKVSSPDFDA